MSIVIKPSRNGHGIFAERLFSPNEAIFEVKGKIFHYAEVIKIGGKFSDNTFRFDEETYLSPEGQIGDFLNHSCDPNSKVVKKHSKLFIAAIKDILPGQEIVIDYSTILADDDIWEMDCNCGSINCRKKVQKITLLPEELFKEYKQSEIVPDYILGISH
jgi:hypothetical protein